MVRYRRILPFFAIAFILTFGGSAAAADGYDGLVLKPQMFTRGAAAVEGATVPGYLDIEGGAFIDFMGPSLKLVQNGAEEQIVGPALTVNLMTAVGLWYGTEAGLMVPIVPYRAVSDKPAYRLNSAAIGDIALNLKYQILGSGPDDWKLGAGPVLFFPTGSLDQLTGAGNFAFALLVAGEKSFGPVTAIANLGYHYRPTATFLKTETGMSLPVRAAVEYWVVPASLAVVGEVNSAIGIKGGTPAEGYLEAKYNLGFVPVSLLAGGGGGFTSALGVPPWRVFASAIYTFKNEPSPERPAAEVKMEPPKWMMKDSDADGVPDDVDKCPEAPGPAETQGCPPAPLVPPPAAQPVPAPAPQPAPVPAPAPAPAAKPAVDDSLPALGIPDKDKDGVPNDKDDCPDAAGPDWRKGCPVNFEKKLLSFNTIVFGKNNADILPESFKVLDAVVAALKDSPKVKVRIEGHTDNVGDAGRNISLSNQRALNVMSYLIAKGIDAGRLSYIGYGGSQPISALKSEEGRRQNRRIEFRVME